MVMDAEALKRQHELLQNEFAEFRAQHAALIAEYHTSLQEKTQQVAALERRVTCS
jgi:phage shock protein A